MANLNENYRELRLDNGLFVALQETPTQTISGHLRVFHGGLHEKAGEEGLAHFLEHTLMTGGSQRYDPETADKIRGTFGEFNAFTSSSKTSFPVDMLAEDLKLYLDFISDLVFHPRLDNVRVEEERQAVLRETSDAKGQPSFKDARAYQVALYGPDSPHTYFTLGKEEVISNASIDDLRRFHGRGYHANNMDLILAGALPKNIDDLISQTFGDKPAGTGKKFEYPTNKPIEDTIILHSEAPDLYIHENPQASNAFLRIGFVAPPKTEEDTYAIRILAGILGGGGNSRLFKAVRQRKGLAYSVGCGYDSSDNQGAIHIMSNVHAQRSEEAIDTIFDEMKLLQEAPVDADDLERIKKTMRYNLVSAFETNGGQAHAIEFEIDNGFTPEHYVAKLGKVTQEQVREVATKYLPSREEGKYVLLLRDPLKS